MEDVLQQHLEGIPDLQCDSGTARDVILFSTSWFKFHPNKDSCGKAVTVWECDIFESQCGHLIPMYFINVEL